MISFFLLKVPGTPLVVGYPWLHQHNSLVDWGEGRIFRRSTWCHEHCLQSATPSIVAAKPVEPSLKE